MCYVITLPSSPTSLIYNNLGHSSPRNAAWHKSNIKPQEEMWLCEFLVKMTKFFSCSSSLPSPFITVLFIFLLSRKLQGNLTWRPPRRPSHSFACSTSCLLLGSRRRLTCAYHLTSWTWYSPIIRSESHAADILSNVYQILWTGGASWGGVWEGRGGGHIVQRCLSYSAKSFQEREEKLSFSSRSPPLAGVHATGEKLWIFGSFRDLWPEDRAHSNYRSQKKHGQRHWGWYSWAGAKRLRVLAEKWGGLFPGEASMPNRGGGTWAHRGKTPETKG